MSKLKGTAPEQRSTTIRGVKIFIKPVPFGKLQEFMDTSKKLRDGDDESLKYVQQVILDYTDITVEEDYNPFGSTDDALTLEECTQLFGAIINENKKKSSGKHTK